MKTETDLALLVVSTVLLGLIAGTYSAMQILSYGRLERNGDDEGSRTRFIDRLLDDPMMNYFALGLGRLFAFVFVIAMSYRFASVQLFEGEGLSPGLLVFVGLMLLVPIALAKLIALKDPERFVELARFVTYPIIYLLRPVVYLPVTALRRLSSRALGMFSFAVLPFKKRIELLGYKNGQEETDEQVLVSSVFEFGDTKVREVMVPRIDMVAVNINMNSSEALDVIIEAGHSRVPVFDESIDRVVGMVHTKDLLRKIVNEEDFSLADIRRDVHFIPEGKMIDELLSEFRSRKIHIAIVVDEYGGTAGLITLEDILEELVGDIQDEFDTEEELIKRLDDDAALCNARVRLDDLNEALGLELPEGDVDTLGGLLYEMIGRVPRKGESFSRGGLEFRIQSVVRQRIDKVLIKGLSSEEKGIGGGMG
jgi:CBS domain containing-hemolysin-like protein